MARRPAQSASVATRLLAKYRSKRDFSKTREPVGKPASGKTGHSYLIQKHAARRLHYDFRLELDGVLKSWAVTKGPSLDPAMRRLAVHVEDHPLAYGEFEGTIPQGQYGGGTVMLWDEGSWEPVGDPRQDYARGKLKFILHGERLKGHWMLVRMGGRAGQEKGRDNWLLIKEHDEFERPGKGDTLLESVTKSVVSGKTMEQIGDPRTAQVWQSKPRGDSAAPKKPAPRTTSRKSPPAPRVDLAAIKGARRATLPDFIAPELATLVDKPPQSGEWLHEIKIDGYRAYCRRDGDDVRLLTRSGQDWTHRFGKLPQLIEGLPGESFALDGEIAAFDDSGVSSFSALQEVLSESRTEGLCYVVFDLLHRDGWDLQKAALVDRKTALRDLLAGAPKLGVIRYSEHLETEGAEVFKHACQLALEGIVSKRAEQPYRSGRGTDWLKSKCISRQEFVIGGFTRPKKAGRGGIGSLLIGYYAEEKLRYAGHVGTGFTQASSRDILARLEKLKTSAPPFPGTLPAEARRGAIWVKPSLVCEVEFRDWTRDGVLRHPSFQGLREDKPARSITRDRTVPLPAGASTSRAAAARSKPARVASPPAKAPAEKAEPHEVEGITISHPDREVFPEIHITKEELAIYYGAVAAWILPEIAGRPLSLVRCPGGAGGQCFFQKHFATGAKSLHRVAIKEKHGTTEYLVARNAHDLVQLIQEGVIELHPWGALADDPDKPDRLIFDLDPAPNVKFPVVIDAARAMREFLQGLELESFVKTTGGKGLHVVVPLKRGIAWPALKDFARAVAGKFPEAQPGAFTISPLKRERTGKIFLDYLRNDRGSTAVAGYCVRARPKATVALPLDWAQLKPGLDPAAFDVNTVPGLLRQRKADPWRELYKTKQTISAAARRALGLG